MARLNISLDADLYAQIKKQKRAINASEICARALRSALKNIEARKGMTGDLQAAVARLRASKAAVEDEERQWGYRAGWSWAAESANFVALRDSAESYAEDSCLITLPEDAGLDLPEVTDRQATGFAQAVVEFWEKVSPALD